MTAALHATAAPAAASNQKWFAVTTITKNTISGYADHRARAQTLRARVIAEIATRPVRVIVLSFGLVFAKGAGIFDAELLAPSIYAMAALTALTVVQRVWHVRRELSVQDV